MTQDTPSIAAIVDGLSEAMRRACRRSTELGSVAPTRATADALIRRGLAVREFETSPRILDWTPLGLAVRTALQEQSK